MSGNGDLLIRQPTAATFSAGEGYEGCSLATVFEYTAMVLSLTVTRSVTVDPILRGSQGQSEADCFVDCKSNQKLLEDFFNCFLILGSSCGIMSSKKGESFKSAGT